MKIIELPDKLLREKSLPVKLPLNNEDQKIAEELIEYLVKAENSTNDLKPGIGISAVQLGYLKRMFYVRLELTEENIFEELLVNPVITNHSQTYGALAEGEGCLSVPPENDREGLVHRYHEISIKGYSYFKKANVKYDLKGLLAIVFQHEYDHLEGKLYFDRIDYLRPEEMKKNEIII